MISTGTPSRRPSSRPRSTATPRYSPVAGSVAVSRKFPRLMPTRSLPAGASSDSTAGVHSVIAITHDVENFSPDALDTKGHSAVIFRKSTNRPFREMWRGYLSTQYCENIREWRGFLVRRPVDQATGQLYGHGPEQECARSMPQRFIAHLDMDAFYASVELLRYPQLRGRPVVIGGRRRAAEGEPTDSAIPTLRGYAGRGVITTATYEARALGVHSGMGLMKA